MREGHAGRTVGPRCNRLRPLPRIHRESWRAGILIGTLNTDTWSSRDGIERRCRGPKRSPRCER